MIDSERIGWERPDIVPLEEMKKEKPERIALKSLIIIGICLMVFSSVVSSVGVVLIRDTQQTNSPIAKDTHSLVEYVKDCNDPEGECHQKSLEQTASILDDLDAQNRKVSAAGAGCSIGIPDAWSYEKRYRHIRRCIDRTLAQ